MNSRVRTLGWIALAVGASSASSQSEVPQAATPLECHYRSPLEWVTRLRAAIASGAIPDPATKVLPTLPLRPEREAFLGGAPGPLILPFEDTQNVLLDHFPDEVFIVSLMVEGANALLAGHGDNFDYIGFWVNFPLLGGQAIGGFSAGIRNEVLGLGDPSGGISPADGIFDMHAELGLAGERIQGLLFFTDINDNRWRPGAGANARNTRLLVNHEFEHRWALHLPALSDGRLLQGPDDNCGRGHHWNGRVDSQGSCMEVSEWVGSNPATRLSGGPINARFNSDIPDGVFSYTDLYLMGMVSPAEMDAGNSELRYMDSSNCNPTYNGPISSFSSADIVAVAGPRIPDATLAPRHFRAAWVMIHRPGDPPSAAELDKLAAILAQQEIDWNVGTLGRSTMDNSLSVRPYGCGPNPAGSLTVVSGTPSIGSTLVLGVDNPLGTQGVGSLPFVMLTSSPDALFPCGSASPGFGMAGPGERLLSPLARTRTLMGAPWSGPGMPAPVAVDLPLQTMLLGRTFYAQGLLVDPAPGAGVKFGLTEGLEIRVTL